MTDLKELFARTSSFNLPFKWFDILKTFDLKFKIYVFSVPILAALGIWGFYYYSRHIQSINDKYTRIINSERLCRNNLLLVQTIFWLPYKLKNHFHLISYNEWIKVALNKKKKQDHEEYELCHISPQGSNSNIPIININTSFSNDELESTKNNSSENINRHLNDINLLDISLQSLDSDSEVMNDYNNNKNSSNNNSNNSSSNNVYLKPGNFNSTTKLLHTKNQSNNSVSNEDINTFDNQSAYSLSLEASSISSLSSSNITSSSPKLGSPPNESILFPSRNTNNPNLPSSSSNNRINRVPTTIQFKTPEGMENKDKAVNFDENKILAGTRKHKHHYTPTIYFFFPNLIFDNKYTSISLYCINMLISFLLSLAYIPYIFIFFYIYGIYIMCSIIPPITQGWNPSESMPLMKGTCFFLFGACGFFIYQSIRYYRKKAILKREKKKKKKSSLKDTIYRKFMSKSFRKKNSRDNNNQSNENINDISYLSSLSNGKGNESSNGIRITDEPEELPYQNSTDNNTLSNPIRHPTSSTDSMNWQPRIKRVYPQYTYWIKDNISNYFQIATLIIQVFQLINFPIEDIYNTLDENRSYYNEKMYRPFQWIANISNYFDSILMVKDTAATMPFTFITIWWFTIFLAVIFIFIYVMDTLIIKKYVDKTDHPKLYRIIKRVSGLKWLSSLIPIFKISYIMVLYSYTETLSCLLNWSGERRELCEIVHKNPGFFIKFFIIGFPIAYYILSAIVISNEPLPEPGSIAFTSRSVIVTKHTTLLIMLLYNILNMMIAGNYTYETNITLHVVRCSLAAGVNLLSVIYIGYIGTCYVRIIDAWRIFFQLVVLWACVISLIVAINTSSNHTFVNDLYMKFGGKAKAPTNLLLLGSGILLVVISISTYIYIKKNPGGIGEDGIYGHGTKSYTEAFLPRNNNVAISSIKNLLLNNIKYHKSSKKAKPDEATEEEGVSPNSSAHHHNHINSNTDNESGITSPSPRLKYLQDELKSIEDDLKI